MWARTSTHKHFLKIKRLKLPSILALETDDREFHNSCLFSSFPTITMKASILFQLTASIITACYNRTSYNRAGSYPMVQKCNQCTLSKWSNSTKWSKVSWDLYKGETQNEFIVIVNENVFFFRFFETETASICLDFTECGPCYESATWA